MLRIIVYLVLVFAVAAGAAWVADHPGTVTVEWLGWRAEPSMLTVFAALVVLVVLVMLAWKLVSAIVGSPGAFRRVMTRRKRERGHQALSRGLVAVGAGDAKLARRYSSEAHRALPHDPATRLLEAQSAQLNGEPERAREIFKAMLADPETRVLGLHGLHVEALRAGDADAARRLAAEANAAAPALPWAGHAVFADAAADGDWDQALAILRTNAHNGLVDKATAKRQRAVLLTARATELEDRDPEAARAAAIEAHGLAPDLVPAAVVAGRLLTRLGDMRRAIKVLETTWKKAPHPEIAEAYAHVRTGDSARDRLKRLRALAALKPGEVEGRLAIARAAIDARAFDDARAELRTVIADRPTQRAFLMMADLDEAEHGDMGRVREWLGRAVRAPRDPVWTADGVVAERWAPISPAGRLDAFEWRAPLEAIDGPAAASVDDALFAPPAAPPVPALVTAPTPPAAVSPVATEIAAPPTASPSPATASASPAPGSIPAPATAAAAAAVAKSIVSAPVAPVAPVAASGPIRSSGAIAPAPASPPVPAAKPDGAESAQSAAGAAERPPWMEPASAPAAVAGGPGEAPSPPGPPRPVEFPLPHLPDDPGPAATARDAASRRGVA